MIYGKKHLISWIYQVLLASVVVIPICILSIIFLLQCQKKILSQAKATLTQSANEILNLARQRYDQIRLYQFQEQNYLNNRLSEMAEVIVTIYRQSELDPLRKFFPRPVAQSLVLNTIPLIKFGETGYCYIITKEGQVVYHPRLPAGFDAKVYPFIQEMLDKKEGIIRYWWKNPGEAESRERLVAYRTLYAWDWLVGVAVPLSDVVDSTFEEQQLNGFYDFIRSLRLNWLGEVILLTKDYKILAHPAFTGKSWEDIPGAAEMIKQANGICKYSDPMARTWWAGVAEFEPWGWIIGVSARENEILSVYYSFRNYYLLIMSTLCLIIIFVQRFILRKLILHVYLATRRGATKAPSEASERVQKAKS
jgi:hypothetical protein